MGDFQQFWVDLWNQICAFFTNTEHGISVLNKLLIAISILVVGLLLTKFVFYLLRKAFKVNDINNKSPKKTVARFIINACKTIIVFIIILFALSTLGFEMSGVSTIISSGILAVGVSLQDVIGNFASGIIILSSKLYLEGDYVEVNDNIKGTVKEIKMMTTILTTPDNIAITVPNKTMTTGKVMNYNSESVRRVDITVGVAYGTDLQAAKKVLMNCILSDKRILRDHDVTVAVKQLNDSSIDFCVRGYVKNSDYWPVNFDLNELIATELAKRGINIPFNQLDVNLYNNGEQPANKVDLKGIPKDILDYKPVVFEQEPVNEIDKAIEKATKIFKKGGRKTKAKTAEQVKASQDVVDAQVKQDAQDMVKVDTTTNDNK